MVRILAHKRDPGNRVGLHHSRFRRYSGFPVPAKSIACARAAAQKSLLPTANPRSRVKSFSPPNQREESSMQPHGYPPQLATRVLTSWRNLDSCIHDRGGVSRSPYALANSFRTAIRRHSLRVSTDRQGCSGLGIRGAAGRGRGLSRGVRRDATGGVRRGRKRQAQRAPGTRPGIDRMPAAKGDAGSSRNSTVLRLLGDYRRDADGRPVRIRHVRAFQPEQEVRVAPEPTADVRRRRSRPCNAAVTHGAFEHRGRRTISPVTGNRSTSSWRVSRDVGEFVSSKEMYNGSRIASTAFRKTFGGRLRQRPAIKSVRSSTPMR